MGNPNRADVPWDAANNDDYAYLHPPPQPPRQQQREPRADLDAAVDGISHIDGASSRHDTRNDTRTDVADGDTGTALDRSLAGESFYDQPIVPSVTVRNDLTASPATKAAIAEGPSSATKAAIDAALSPNTETRALSSTNPDGDGGLFAPDGPVYNPTSPDRDRADIAAMEAGTAAPTTPGVFRSLHCTHCEEMVALWHCDPCGGRYCSHCDAFIHKAPSKACHQRRACTNPPPNSTIGPAMAASAAKRAVARDTEEAAKAEVEAQARARAMADADSDEEQAEEVPGVLMAQTGRGRSSSHAQREAEAATEAALLGKCRVSAVAEAHAEAEAGKASGEPAELTSPSRAPAVGGDMASIFHPVEGEGEAIGEKKLAPGWLYGSEGAYQGGQAAKETPIETAVPDQPPPSTEPTDPREPGRVGGASYRDSALSARVAEARDQARGRALTRGRDGDGSGSVGTGGGASRSPEARKALARPGRDPSPSPSRSPARGGVRGGTPRKHPHHKVAARRLKTSYIAANRSGPPGATGPSAGHLEPVVLDRFSPQIDGGAALGGRELEVVGAGTSAAELQGVLERLRDNDKARQVAAGDAEQVAALDAEQVALEQWVLGFVES